MSKSLSKRGREGNKYCLKEERLAPLGFGVLKEEYELSRVEFLEKKK